MVVRFMPSAASFIRCLPTGTDPVKLILRITGEAIRWLETSAGSPKTTCATPDGRPASTRQRIISIGLAGVSSAGLRMIEQPAAIAGASLRTGVKTGKFHGLNAATGPTG